MKGTGFKMVADVTKRNTGLIRRLINHPKIGSAWHFNGVVYGKIHRTPQLGYFPLNHYSR